MTFDSPTTLVLGAAALVALLALDPQTRRTRLVVWLAVLALALGGPRIQRERPAEEIVVLIDGSASAGDRGRGALERLRAALPEAAVLRGGEDSDLGRLLAEGATHLPPGAGAIVMVSDGLDLGTSLDSSLAALAARGTPVHVVAIPAPAPAVRLLRIACAPRVSVGAPVSIRASLAGGPAVVQLRGSFRGQPATLGERFEVTRGDSPTFAAMTLRAPEEPGVHVLTIDVLPADDVPVLVGTASCRIVVGSAEPVALLGDAALPAGWPERQLPAHRLAARAFDPGELEDYVAVVCGGRLDPAVARALTQAVRRGETGLVLQGGPLSFGAGGWQRGPLGEMSPLDPEPEDRRPVRVVVLADRSGSMTEERVQATRAAAARLLQVMGSGDWLSLVPYAEEALDSGEPLAMAPVPVGDGSARDAFLGRLLARYPAGPGRGGTSLGRAVSLGLELLDAGEDPDQRLLVMITDAELAADDLELTYDRLRSRGERVQVVALLTGASPGGLAPEQLRAAGVPGVTVRDASGASAELGELLAGVFDEATGGRWVEEAPGEAVSTTGVALGRVGLVNRTRQRTGVPLDASAGGLPLVATWQRGRGRVTAVAGRPAEEPGWGGELLDSSQFWAGIVRGVAPKVRDGALEAVAVPLRGGRTDLRVHTSDGGGAPGSPADAPRLEMLTEEGAIDPGPQLTLVAPGRWAARVDARGAAGVPFAVATASRRVPVQGQRPGSTELERLEPDLRTLQRIANASGGALHEAVWTEDPAGVVRGMHHRSGLPIAPWLLLSAALAMAGGWVLPVARRAPGGIA